MNPIGAEAALKPGRGRHRVRQVAGTAFLLGLAVAAFFFWRATSIATLPEVADPFDRDREGVVAIPDEDNAFTFYRRAYDAFKPEDPQLRSDVYLDWSAVGDRELAILDGRKEALALWFEGTKRARAVLVQPIEANCETILNVNQRLRAFSRIANLSAFRLQHDGDYAGAWTWIRANLRAGRHSGMNGFVIERAIGTAITGFATKQASHWADDPKADVKLLRQALDDALAIDAMTAPYREMARSEFFGAMNTLDNPEVRERMITIERPTGKDLSGTMRNRLTSRLATLYHEPERSRRVARLVVANWLSACDLPTSERNRRLVKIGRLPLFQPGAGESAPIRPEVLAVWFESTRYMGGLLDVWSGFADIMNRDEQARATLLVHLAEQLYTREHGRPPASVDLLVGPYLKAIPAGYTPPEGGPR